MKIVNNIKNKSIILIKIIYERFFGMPITTNIYTFIKNVSWSFVGIAITMGIMVLVHILGGRIMGPKEYGLYGLLFSIATIFTLPMVMSFPTTIQKYVVCETKQEKKQIISTAYATVLILTGLWMIIYVALRKQIMYLFKINPDIFIIFILLTGGYTLYQITEATMHGLLKIKENSLIKIISFLVLFIIFVYLLFFKKNTTYLSLVIPLTIAYLLFSALVLIKIRAYFFEFNKKWIKEIFSFGFYAMLAKIFFIIMVNTDRVLINHFLSLTDVGIYQAYLTSSQAVNLFLTPFLAVYFPTVSKSKNKKGILKRINKLEVPVFIFIFLFLIIITFIALKLYGRQYPTYFRLIILFAISGGLFVLHGLYSFLLGSQDVQSMKRLATFCFVAVIVNLISNIVLIPAIGIYGSAGASIITYSVLLCLYKYNFKKGFAETL